MVIRFWVYGTPWPKGSMRAMLDRRTGRPFLIPDNDPRLRAWMRAVATTAKLHRPPTPLDCALEVTLTFFLERPKGHYGSGRNAGEVRPSAPPFPDKRLDVDKLVRSTLDALTGIATKLYARRTTGAYIVVQPFDPTTKEIEAHGTHEEEARADEHPWD